MAHASLSDEYVDLHRELADVRKAIDNIGNTGPDRPDVQEIRAKLQRLADRINTLPASETSLSK